MVDDLGQAKPLDRVRRLAQLFDVALLAWPFGGGDVIAPVAEVLGERIPAPRREPGAVNQHQWTAGCGTLHDDLPVRLPLPRYSFGVGPATNEIRYRKAPLARGFRVSPLTDSNRRPPPYHRTRAVIHDAVFLQIALWHAL